MANPTQLKIEEKALQLFNQSGIEYVGMREIAAALEMRIGNLTYYFPTKDDLVFAIRNKLSESNSEIMVVQKGSLRDFLETLRAAFTNQWQYRSFLLSFVHLVQQNDRIKASYDETRMRRNEFLTDSIREVMGAGYLRKLKEQEHELLIATISLIARFWLSESTIIHSNKPLEEQVSQHLRLIAFALQPFATEKGQQQLEQYIS